MKKKNILFIVLGLIMICTYLPLKAQTIPTYLFGENAWLPDSIGTVPYWGILQSNWNIVKQSNVKLVRVGGHAPDVFRYSNSQYLKMVDSIRANGMEPILQIPFIGNGVNFDSATAHNIIYYINITHGRKVKYWAIGNEPDLYSNINAAKITTYIHNYAIAMKKVDPSIFIVGPAVSYLHSQNSFDGGQKRVDTLTTWNGSTATNIVGIIPSGNGSATGKAYVDFFDYHMYNYDGSSNGTPPSRAWLIGKLTSTSATVNGDSANMGWIKRRCDLINANVTGRSTYQLKPMITEANICLQNYPAPTNDVWSGVKASSFFAGQQWSEMMSLAIYQGIQSVNFWSISEGAETGYLTSTGTKKSTYYHIQEMAKWFTGTHYIGTDNQTNIKAFGTVDGDHIAVMILDQDTVSPATNNIYKIRLDGSYASGTGTRIKMGMGTYSTEYTDTILPSSTTLLIFDCNGTIAFKYRYQQTDQTHPFKSVWAASSPAIVYSVNAGPDDSICCSQFTYLFTATPSSGGGTHTYQWYKNGTSVSGATSSTWTSPSAAFASNSINTVKVIMTTNSCTTSDDLIFKVGGGRHYIPFTDSIASGAISSIQSLVPNPAGNQLSIYYLLVKGSNQSEISIVNIYGQTMKKYLLNPEDEKLDVDCSNLTNGIYFTRLSVNGKIVNTKKLLIAK